MAPCLAPAVRSLGLLLCVVLVLPSDGVATSAFRPEKAARKHGAKCMKPGRLNFAHVMKSGGLAVDAYLACRCEQERCSISHHEGGNGTAGDLRCTEPSVCTSHSPPYQMHAECDVDFSRARSFTVLRDPVERVVSFYNYARFPRLGDGYPGYAPYQATSLMDVLQAWGKLDLDDGQPKSVSKGGCLMCAAQLSNAMVLRHFVSAESAAEQRKWNKTAGVLVPPSHRDMRFQLEEAKKTLASMDAVFLSVSTFKEAFEELDLLSPKTKDEPSGCEVPVVNPTSQKVEPSAEELQLIAQLNWADIELYNFAQTLPHARK